MQKDIGAESEPDGEERKSPTALAQENSETNPKESAHRVPDDGNARWRGRVSQRQESALARGTTKKREMHRREWCAINLVSGERSPMRAGFTGRKILVMTMGEKR